MKIVTLEQQQHDNDLVADRRLWLTESGDEVVEDGDVRAAFLLVAPGCGIPPSTVERLGLVVEDGAVRQKQATLSEDKQAAPSEDKSGRRKARTKIDPDPSAADPSPSPPAES